mmetsp:Transcript_46393/g.122971  ORF Transcript_46393/g.122971 Transcript_46393/m.122971 type:complete len:262 (+) Transcript_46393:2423-3208(+)
MANKQKPSPPGSDPMTHRCQCTWTHHSLAHRRRCCPSQHCWFARLGLQADPSRPKSSPRLPHLRSTKQRSSCWSERLALGSRPRQLELPPRLRRRAAPSCLQPAATRPRLQPRQPQPHGLDLAAPPPRNRRSPCPRVGLPWRAAPMPSPPPAWGFRRRAGAYGSKASVPRHGQAAQAWASRRPRLAAASTPWPAVGPPAAGPSCPVQCGTGCCQTLAATRPAPGAPTAAEALSPQPPGPTRKNSVPLPQQQQKQHLVHPVP